MDEVRTVSNSFQSKAVIDYTAERRALPIEITLNGRSGPDGQIKIEHSGTIYRDVHRVTDESGNPPGTVVHVHYNDPLAAGEKIRVTRTSIDEGERKNAYTLTGIEPLPGYEKTVTEDQVKRVSMRRDFVPGPFDGAVRLNEMPATIRDMGEVTASGENIYQVCVSLSEIFKIADAIESPEERNRVEQLLRGMAQYLKTKWARPDLSIAELAKEKDLELVVEVTGGELRLNGLKLPDGGSTECTLSADFYFVASGRLDDNKPNIIRGCAASPTNPAIIGEPLRL